MDETGTTTRGVICKYDLAHGQPIQVPAGSKPLSVVWEKPSVRLYVLVDPEVPKVDRQIALISTGHELKGDHWEFVGTVKAPLNLVFHAFISRE